MQLIDVFSFSQRLKRPKKSIGCMAFAEQHLKETLRPILHRAVWSLNLSRLSRHPQKAFCVSELKGDWKWHFDVFQFKRYWRAAWICHACNAVRLPRCGGRMYTDFGNYDAFTETTTVQFIAQGLPPRPTPLICLDGFSVKLLWPGTLLAFSGSSKCGCFRMH